MKKTFLAFVTILLLLITSFNLEAQQARFRAAEDQPGTYVVDFEFTADSAASVFYSTSFTPPYGYNNVSWSTYPITSYYDLNVASGSPKVIISVFANGPNSSVFAIDSLGIGTGVGDTLVSATANKCQLTMNGYKANSYKIGVTQIETGKALTRSYVRLIFTKPD